METMMIWALAEWVTWPNFPVLLQKIENTGYCELSKSMESTEDCEQSKPMENGNNGATCSLTIASLQNIAVRVKWQYGLNKISKNFY